MRRATSLALAAVAGLCLASSASATVLSPGDGPTGSSDVPIPGTLIATQTLSGHSGATPGTGLVVSVVEDVYRRTNGDLTFTYKITNKSKPGSGHFIDIRSRRATSAR